MRPIVALRMGGSVYLHNDLAVQIVTHPADATATLTVDNAGNVDGGNSGTYAWLKSGGNASAYEIEATLNSGTVTGTFGSWLNLGTSRSWTLTRTTTGTNVGTITIQIRPVGGSAVATATITFQAEVD